MLIDCPACARSYHVSRDEIGTRGRTVVCPRCQAHWYVEAAGRADLAIDAVSRRVQPEAAGAPSPAPRRAAFAGMRPLTIAVACVVGLMLIIGAREPVVRMMPRLARAYALAGLPVNIRGLEFVHVVPARSPTSSTEMTIAGTIRNVTDRRVRIPRLAYEIRDAGGAALVTWSEAAPVSRLAAGDSLPFVSGPHDLPNGAVTVFVRFQSDDAIKPATMHLARNDDR